MTRPLAEQQMKAELLAQGLKLCTKCGKVKSIDEDEFAPRPKNSDGLECWCRVCRREYARQWRQDNLERALAREQAYNKTPQRQAYVKQYKEENKEHLEEVYRQWYEENREAILARGRDLYYRRRDKVLARQKVYRQVYKVQRNEYNKKWHRRNPDKTRAQKRRYRANNRERVLELDRQYALQRRARLAGAEGSHTHEQWLELLAFFNGICPRCREEKELTQDHIEPLDWGGSNYLANLQPLCQGCNSKKNNRYAADYRPRHVRKWAHEEVMRELGEAELAEAA